MTGCANLRQRSIGQQQCEFSGVAAETATSRASCRNDKLPFRCCCLSQDSLKLAGEERGQQLLCIGACRRLMAGVGQGRGSDRKAMLPSVVHAISGPK